jgi:TonB family protein
MNIGNRIGVFSLGFLLLAVGCRGSHTVAETSTSIEAPRKDNLTGTILHMVKPVYPAAARAARVQGTVTLHAIIATDGSVESLEAIDGPMMLRGAAVDAVKQWVYAPYILNGIPRRVDTKVTVSFRLTPASNNGGSGS